MEGARSALSITVATSRMWRSQWKSITIPMKNFTSSVAAATLSTHKPHVPLVAITSDSAAIKDSHRCKIALWCILLARPGPTVSVALTGTWSWPSTGRS